MGTLGGFPSPLEFWLRRAKPAYANAMAALWPPWPSFWKKPVRWVRAFYQRLKLGKLRKVALVAAMRKLLTILNAMVRDQTPWRSSNVETAS